MALNVESKTAVVVDPHKHKERFLAWDGTLPDVNKHDAALIVEYIQDMQHGINVNSKRGKRSPTRLNTIRSRMAVLSRLVATNTGQNLVTVSEEDLLRLFSKMREGKITRQDGKIYKSVADYTISYKAFWHWYMKRQRKKGELLEDKTVDLDTSQEKPKFHYLTYDQVKLMADHAKPYYKMLIWFLYDSGIRAPTECNNVRVDDLMKLPDGFYQLEIRDETSKTFGRKIKLLLCSEMLDSYIKQNNLRGKDFLFTTTPTRTNEYLSRLGYRLFKVGTEGTTPDKVLRYREGKEVWIDKPTTVVREGITMYDFRHCSACYWLPKYKNESSLKYRFGWKNSDMIHYYTEFLGMKDTITQDDLIDAEEKTKLQKEIEIQRQRNALIEEQMAAMQASLRKMEMMIVKSHQVIGRSAAYVVTGTMPPTPPDAIPFDMLEDSKESDSLKRKKD